MVQNGVLSLYKAGIGKIVKVSKIINRDNMKNNIQGLEE